MKKLRLWMLGILAVAGTMVASGQAVDIMVDDFSSGTVTFDNRVRPASIDMGWVAASGVSPTNSEWIITGGQMENSATNAGNYPVAVPAEGALANVVSHGADTNNTIDVSFDYAVGTNDSLYIHLWGLDSPAALTADWFSNPQGGNGGLSDQTSRNAGLTAYSLKDGSSPSSGAIVVLTGSGTYTNSINIEAFDISGITEAGDFEYYLIGFAKQEDGTVGTTSIDNLSITSSYSAPVIEPPPPSGVTWENDMSTDPVGDGWTVRNSKANYTIGGGILSMGEGAFSTLLDSDPYDEFIGVTKVDLTWRATSHSDPAANYGAGLWLNCDGSAPTYYPMILSSVLNTNDNMQTVKIFDPGNGISIATIPGFGTGMIEAQATIDSFNETLDYILTDGSLSVTGMVSLAASNTGGAGYAMTLFTAGASAEIDYVKLVANAQPDAVYFGVDPAALALQLFETDSTVDGELDVTINAATNLDVTITISDEDYPGSFIVLSDTNQVLSPPGTTTMDFQFDRTVANLTGGQTATGLVTIAWSEVGGGESGSVMVPISGSVGFSASQNTWNGGGNGVNWGDAANWSLSRVPGAIAADPASITDGSTVTVATTAPNAFAPLGSLTIGVNSTLAVEADLPAVSALTIDGVIDINGGTFTIDNAAANDLVNGGGLIKLRSGTLGATATVATRSDTYECAFEISGGTVNMKHQGRYTGGLTIIGDAATVNMGFFNGSSILNFELGENGVSTIDGSGTWAGLAAATINVDGSAYTGGSQEIILLKSSNLASTSTAVTVTGFASNLTTVVTQDVDDNQLVILTITAPPYFDWEKEYGVSGSTNNPDGDSLNNLYEYGLKGDPTNGLDIGIAPVIETGEGYVDYVHVNRVAASNEISYALAITSDLQFGAWTTNTGYTIVGYGPVVDGFDTVTNRVSTDVEDSQFIQLIIEEL